MPDERPRLLRIRNDELEFRAFGDDAGGAYALSWVAPSPFRRSA